MRKALAEVFGRMSLAGRLIAIVLAILVTDFASNSIMFERANSFTLHSEEAERMAEHLVVAQRMVGSAPRPRRAELARQVSTERFRIEWVSQREPENAPIQLATLHKQIIAAEPELARTELRLRILPLARGGGIEGSILLSDGSALEFRSSNPVSWSLNAGLLLQFSLPSLVLLALAWWLIRGSLQPLKTLVRAASQVGTDDLDPLPETGQSEVRQLIRAFNRMHERIHQLLSSRTQTLLAIGHDMRTPLARLQMRLDGALLDEQTREEMTSDIMEMADLLSSLQDFVESGQEHRAPERLDLAEMVRGQVSDLAEGGADISYSGPASLEVLAHHLGLRRAIANLLQNALRYGERAEVRLQETPAGVELEVADNGPGIPAARFEEVLQPFVRLDEARARNTKGMGLGLAIVDRVVRSENAQFKLANRADGGLSATIVLPHLRVPVTKIA